MKVATPASIIRIGIVLGAMLIAFVFLNALVFRGPITEFTGLSGEMAKERIGHQWPAEVETEDIRSIDYKYHSEFDSHSTWYRITLDPDSALTWADHAHAMEEDVARSYVERQYAIEGVRRDFLGSIPLHRQTGSTPTWWKPPIGNVRVTEVMVWYSGHKTGLARGTYTVFDSRNETLWVYEFSAQHELMWTHGAAPAGNVIDVQDK